MSHQMTDPFYWEQEAWVFLGAEDVYALFDPERYGLQPTAPCTACWKGFIVQFSIQEGQLFLDRVAAHCENGVYPPINGVTPVADGMFHEYRDIRLPLAYSGTIVVGRHLDPMYSYSAFTGPYAYETTYELTIRDGKLVGSRNTSGTYSRF